MTDWMPVVDTETDPDAPITSSLGKRFDNNCIALAEGATGAPKIQPNAIQPSSAGDVVCYTFFFGAVSTQSSSYQSVIGLSGDNSFSATMLTSGVIRVSLSHFSSGGTSIVRVLRGNTVMAEWSSGGSSVYRSVDFYADFGDKITIQHHLSGGGESAQAYLSQPEIKSNRKLPVAA